MTTAVERVVLLDDEGRSVGAAPKATVHTESTPLHLAFSCHVLDPRGRVLLSRRALSKRTWPGTWTNAFCGHPSPFEAIPAALERRAKEELGLVLRDVRLVLPDFRYRAVDASGMVENEVCPVYFAIADDQPAPAPDEAMDVRWVDADDLATALDAAPWAFSPWLVLQARELSPGGAISGAAWRGAVT
ncbi:isopentenyl-diphosphate Delta-isomerase [Microbacterium oryzae]|uniref:Isopentenyl-diphosphate Delta-isomerase n=1 Tax=Microbacterium oryzae TaxID=743009 RepID=A0A6I6DSC7_9MICO|nr:isopentenyl-diphosphate Delta-isomerase [Microbacterium oryzae]QGU27855.1 isopentenyl-diphosphate Delta-isomerase [Microbacterium oryzae]